MHATSRNAPPRDARRILAVILAGAAAARVSGAAGARPVPPALVYCGSGARSAQDYLALRLIGVGVRNCDGSWMEWGSTPSPPVEK